MYIRAYERVRKMLFIINFFIVFLNASFVSSRFGKKKDDKSKDPAKGSKNRLEALSEEELDRIPDRRDG